MRVRGVRLLIAAAAATVALAAPGLAEAAPWCGTASPADRPLTQAGYLIHVFYAYPADGVDRSAEVAPRIWSDIEEIDAWWRAQDPARTPHFDLTRFACGPQIDLTVRKLSFDTAAMSSATGRWDRIRADLFTSLRVDGTWTKYLVYYDGPVESPLICGDGGGGVTGTGLAIVYLGACPGQSTAATAAHELLHALGALFRVSAPNACPGDPGHVCDSPLDILHPAAYGPSLAERRLDVGGNDYYRHRQSWFDVRESKWMRTLDRRALVRLRMAGRGTVRSDVPGIACTSSCTTNWNPRTAMILRAAPAAGQKFVRWVGAGCDSTHPECHLLLDETESLSAVFAPFRYQLNLSVAGRGRITGRGVSCATACRGQVNSHRPFPLRAVPAPGWRLRGWSGACRGAKTTCTVPMTRATTVRATFVRAAT